MPVDILNFTTSWVYVCKCLSVFGRMCLRPVYVSIYVCVYMWESMYVPVRVYTGIVSVRVGNLRGCEYSCVVIRVRLC